MSANKPVQISYSSASTFKTCPTKYYLSRRYRVKQNPSAFAFGKALEDAISELFLGKTLEEAHTKFQTDWAVLFDTEIQYSPSDFDSNVFIDEDREQVKTWAQELHIEVDPWEDFENTQEQIKFNNKCDPSSLKLFRRIMWQCLLIKGLVMIRSFHDKLLPKLTLCVDSEGKPALQKAITIENSTGDKVTGFVDYIVKHEDFEHPIILDLKTAAYPYPEHAIVSSEQLRTYVAAIGAEFDTRTAGYLVLVKKINTNKKCNKCNADRVGRFTKCECGGTFTATTLDSQVQLVTKEYNESELEDVLNDYMNVAVAVKNNINYKVPGNCNLYNRPCEFYNVCWKNKKPEEVEHLEEKTLTTPDPADTVEKGE